MKRLSIFCIVLVSLFELSSFAQSAKDIAHIDSNALLQWMPARSVAERELQVFSDDLENQLSVLNSELENKVQDFQNRKDQLDQATEKKLLDEISALEIKTRDFTQQAQIKIENKEEELIDPIIATAKRAIQEVADEKGYTYVIDSGAGVLLVWPDSQDIMGFVKDKILSYQ